eukprot:1159473-Pelagomonas_calceolata.AAC.2
MSFKKGYNNNVLYTASREKAGIASLMKSRTSTLTPELVGLVGLWVRLHGLMVPRLVGLWVSVAQPHGFQEH